MASEAMQLEIVTPEGPILNEQVTKVVLRTQNGEIGILPKHANLKTKLQYTALRYTKLNGDDSVVAVLGGVLELQKNQISIITDFAERGMDIDEAEAERGAEKAKTAYQLLNPKNLTMDKDLLIAEVQLQKEMLRLTTAKIQKSINSQN